MSCVRSYIFATHEKVPSLYNIKENRYTVSEYLVVNPIMPNGIFYLHSSDKPIFNIRGVWLVFIATKFYRNSCFDANSVDRDHAASDFGLHYVPMSLLWDAIGLNGLNLTNLSLQNPLIQVENLFLFLLILPSAMCYS